MDMTKQAELIEYVFDGRPHLLSGAMRQWVEASARFTAFVDLYRDKIRKKIRVIHDQESALDLCGELEVAYSLLQDSRLAVAYEPYASSKRRGPDFAVTYRSNLVFNVEAARIRAKDGAEVDLARREERVLRIMLGKLGQMQPGMANLLAIHTGADWGRTIDLERLMQGVKLRADRKDPVFYAAAHYSGPPAFYKDFRHLSAILLWAKDGPLWVNKQAQPELGDQVLRLVRSLADRSV